MLFNSFHFLHFFLPLFLLLYFISRNNSYRNFIILIASLYFYAYGEGILVLILLASTIVDFYAAIIIEKWNKRIGIVLSLTFNLSILFAFKYYNFFVENLNEISGLNISLSERSLPIGISFFTFQTMSYTIDVYRGHVKPSKNILNFATYVCMFPQLIAGPIVRYKELYNQLAKRVITQENILEGIERFILGFAKKMIIANYFALIADDIFNSGVHTLNGFDCLLGILCYTLQIYFDFSAYSDMAIGLGLILGFKFPENFKYPYISLSIKEFWRRWHITLSYWFRDYVYISLGGNRVSKFRLYSNLFAVFVVTGLWHGASWNFIIWGLIHGTFILLERVFSKPYERIPKLIKWIYTLVVVIVAWVFFRSPDISFAIDYLSTLFSYKNYNLNIFFRVYYINLKFIILFFTALLCSTPMLSNFQKYLIKREVNILYTSIYTIILFILFIISVGYIASGTYDPFIYFRF